MGKALNIDKLAVNFPYKKSAAKPKHKVISLSFLIVCEGKKTEPNYFRGFPKSRGSVVYELDFKGENESEKNMGGISPKKVVEKAIKLQTQKKYDRVWAVFDKDNFKDFDAAILKAKSNNICCAWSNEAFELWYLLHFQYRNTGMPRTKYQKAIEKEVKEKSKKPYKYLKNAADTYEILQKYGNQAQAIKWAENLSKTYINGKFSTHNPRTQVYELVMQLIGEDKNLNEEIKKKFNERE
jgi:hypothetical protein